MASAPVSLTQFDLMSRALDTEFGIIEQVSRMGLQPGESDLHYAVAVSQNPSAISPHSRNTPLPRADRQAAGAGMGWDAALWSTLGESLERYSASIIEPDSITISKGEDLEGPILSPLEFILFGEEQYDRAGFPYLKWTPQDVIAWTKTMRFVTGEELWVPADFVYLAHAGGKPVMSLEPSAVSPVFRAARTSTLNSDSETVDGTLIGKPLGDLPIGDRAFVYGFVGPLTHFTVLPDQLVVFTFDPIATDRTCITVTWLVHRHTSLDEGAIENMTGFWSRTLSEDIALTEAVQQNAGSRFMPSACFAALEQDARIFSAWLKRHMVESETDHHPVQ